MAFAADTPLLSAGAGASKVAAARALTASLLAVGMTTAGSTEAAASALATTGLPGVATATAALARLLWGLDRGEEDGERDALSAKAIHVAKDAITHFSVSMQEHLDTLELDGIEV